MSNQNINIIPDKLGRRLKKELEIFSLNGFTFDVAFEKNGTTNIKLYKSPSQIFLFNISEKYPFKPPEIYVLIPTYIKWKDDYIISNTHQYRLQSDGLMMCTILDKWSPQLNLNDVFNEITEGVILFEHKNKKVILGLWFISQIVIQNCLPNDIHNLFLEQLYLIMKKSRNVCFCCPHHLKLEEEI